MADLSDVVQALVAQAAAALFPGGGYAAGSYATSAATTAAYPGGVVVRLYRGWPTKAVLDADLLLGRTHVTVLPERGMTRLDTRYINAQPEVLAPLTPTLTVAASGATATFGGTGGLLAGGAGQVAGVAVPVPGGPGPLFGCYGYRLLSADTPSTVAAAFTALVPGGSAAGAVLTVAGGTGLLARVVVDQVVTTEFRRQQQMFRVGVWAPDPYSRDAVAGMVDVGITFNQRPILDTGETAYLRYGRADSDDVPAIDLLWRRDLRMDVEYPTSQAVLTPSDLFVGWTANGTPMGAQFQ